MTPSCARPFDGLAVDHVEFFVGDVRRSTRWFTGHAGFVVRRPAETTPPGGATRSAMVGVRDIRLVLTQPLVADHAATAYLERHGDGVASIALEVRDVATAYAEAVRRGARPVSGPAADGGTVTAVVMGFGDVTHKLVQRSPVMSRASGPRPAPGTGGRDAGLVAIDHFAICVEAGRLDDTVRFYERTFDFTTVFAERITVGDQAMNSKVVQSTSGAVTFTVIEPDETKKPGQIDEFLKSHGGAGVQHIAFTARDITRSVATMRASGVDFLTAPDRYYTMLGRRLTLSRYSVDTLRKLHILVDEDHDGQLFQIFARSTHPRGTFFFEIIERLGARTFGSGNIKALYEAVELQRAKEASPGR